MTDKSKDFLIDDTNLLELLDLGRERFGFHCLWNVREAAERLLGLKVEFTSQGSVMVNLDMEENEIDREIYAVKRLRVRIREAMLKRDIPIVDETPLNPTDKNLKAHPIDIIKWAVEQGDIPVCEDCLHFAGVKSTKTVPRDTKYKEREAAFLEWVAQQITEWRGMEKSEIHHALKEEYPNLFFIADSTFSDFWKQLIKNHPEYKLNPGRPKNKNGG